MGSKIDDLKNALIDIDCNDEQITVVLDLLKCSEEYRIEKILRKQKKVLLELLHDTERKVDLADYLIYQLRKNRLEGGEI